MPRVSLNLTEATKREAIPDGIYLCEVDEVSDVEQGPKSSYITVTLKIIDGEYEGRKLFTNLPITGKGAGIFADVWEKLTGEELDWESDGIDVDTDDMLGKKCRVKTKLEEYPEGSEEYQSKVVRVYSV